MMSNSRLKNSSYNVIINLIILLLTTVLTFVTRTFFIKYLGSTLLGVNGLFTNIISMLSLTELGFGAAISFSLYKPLANNDYDQISSIMAYLRKIYRCVAVIIFIAGICLIPILPFFAKGYDGGNLILIYLLYLINTVLGYLIVYKETLIIADQKEHKLFLIKISTIILLYSLQIFVIVTFKNIISYLIVTIFVTFIKNALGNYYVTKTYKKIDFEATNNLSEKDKKSIASNVKNLMLGKIGNYLLNGTDNIIISAINITLTGIYSNYLAILGVLQTLMNVIYNGVIASFGNMFVVEKESVQENVINISIFVCFLISGLITIELLFLINPFIEIWIGKKYIVSIYIVIVICFNYYFYSQNISLNAIKNAAGLYKIDRIIPFVQAFINLTFSIVLGIKYKLLGVVLGTLISHLVIGIFARPYLIYKNLFNKNAIGYYFKQVKYLITLALVALASYSLFKYMNVNLSLSMIFVKAFIVFMIYTLTIILLFSHTKEFKYIIELIIKIIKKTIKKKS